MNAARQYRLAFRAHAAALSLLICLSWPATGAEWPQYRGGNHDGISTDRLNKQWTGTVTNPVWRVPLTNCLGSLTVSGGRVFTQTRRFTNALDQELCVALNATNGAVLWMTPVDRAGYPEAGVGYDDGPRTTPVVSGDSVFVLSSSNRLFRLNLTNGAVIWERNLVSLYGGVVIPWQNAASPVVENGLVFVNANSPTQTLMALRVSDGGPAWRSQNDGMTHATPTLATIHGARQIIFATQSGLVSLNPTNGNLLWRASYPFNYGTSIGVSPVVYQDMVFVSGAHSYGMGSTCVRVNLSNTTWSATRLWATNNPASHWMTPVVHDGFLYGQFGIQSFDSANGQLTCIEMRTGTVKWRTAGFGRGATVLVDDHLVSLTERGDLVLVKPNTNAYTELARFRAIPNYHDFTNKCWNQPAVCDGRLFIRSTAFVASFDLSIPALKMDGLTFGGPGTFDLFIRTMNGAPVASNRLTNIEVRATADIGLAFTQWNRLTNSLVLTGGVARMQNISTGNETQRFFMVSEPK